METSSDQSTLEMLPDEILLEVCKYLLCSDILHSFIGLNHRLTQMISQYRQHVSFHKTSIRIFDHLCISVFPQIGSQIHSIFIDCNYSVLQDRLFMKYFGEKMSIIFPNLQRISLTSYLHDGLVAFLNTLHDLNQLVEIHLYNIFSIPRLQRSALTRLLFQANNHRLTTVLINNSSSSLYVDQADRYFNILRLRIKLKTVADLPSLFAAVPNVQYLDVTIEERDSSEEMNNFKLESPLLHLVHFSLKSIGHPWSLEELMTLLALLPSIRYLSLFLFINNERLVRGDVILPLLPPSIQQFNYNIYCYPYISLFRDTIIVSSWPPSHPITYIFDDKLLFLYTVPWHFSRLEIPSLAGTMITSQNTNANGYDKHVEQVVLFVDKIFSLAKCLTILSECRRVTEIFVNLKDDSQALKEEQLPVSRIAELPRVVQICFQGLIPSDHIYFSIVLNALPNLFRLDLSFAYLLRLIKDAPICSILSQRITSLCIFENEVNSSSVNVKEEHLPIIVSTFPRLRDMYINITHLPCSITKTSSEDVLESCLVQEEEIILPLSSESMLLCLLKAFQEFKLLALCIEGQFVDQVKTDAVQWLRVNSILGKQHFEAVYHGQLKRVLIWM